MKLFNNWTPFLLSITLFVLLFSNCKEESASETQNHAPQIQDLVAQPPTIPVNQQTTLFCIATDEDGDNLIITWTSQIGSFPNGNTGASVNWLAPSTAGDYTITATVSDGKLTDKGDVNITVRSGETAPPPPTLSSPADNATNISLQPTLSWDSSSSADSYTLQVSTNSSFTSYVYNQSGLTNTSQQISGLSNSTWYYWKVNATNSYGTSDWSSHWWFATESVHCPGIPTIIYAGKTYNTVQIGNQCWLKENLNVGKMIQWDEYSNYYNIIEKYCYGNDTTNCKTYGGLYDWNEAMQYSNTAGATGICPNGWHIPTLTEFEILVSYVNDDGNALKAIGQGTSAGHGTNTSGFSALLAGYLPRVNFYFLGLGNVTQFWSSTEQGDKAYRMFLSGQFDDVSIIARYQTNGLSIRCLKD